jgi:transcriptional regulator with XRE-family HTH domain
MIEKQLLIQIGQKIKKIRTEKGLSQVELADLCDFEKSNMARIESGNTNLTIKTLLKISNALKVEIVEILVP